jgi:hypothetical protein
LPNTLNQPLPEQIRHAVPLGHDVAGVAGFVEQEPVAELWVLAVGVEQSVRQMRLRPLGVSDRCFEPPVVGLAGDVQDPARHRDRHPNTGTDRGKLADERVDHFPGRFACDR